MKRDLVIAMTGIHSRIGRALAARLRAEGHTIIPVPRDHGLLPGSDLLIHLGRGTRRLAARLPDAVALPENILTTAAGMKAAEKLGIHVCPVKLVDLRPEEAADMILWAVHLLENRLCMD
jgi:NAD(P)-dependent dehydrogenase (short-subunit alcohol dehydrogenase family)